MGSVHKFRRPPKNEGQFKGFRPGPVLGARGGRRAGWPLRDWHRTVLAWLALLLVATVIWGIGQLF